MHFDDDKMWDKERTPLSEFKPHDPLAGPIQNHIDEVFGKIVHTITIPKNVKAKHDEGKLLFGCLTQGLAPVLKGVAAVLTYGAQKYARNSWQTVPNAKQRYRDAMDRHLNEYNTGNTFDEESGLHHLLHAVCNAMFIMWFEIQENSNYVFTKFKKPPMKEK